MTLLMDGRKNKGFSMLELLLVIAILGIVAAIAVPRFTNANAQRDLDNAARQLVVDLRWTSQMAANSVDTVKMIFVNTSPFGYRVVQGTAETVIKPTFSFPPTVLFPSAVSSITYDVYGKPTGSADVSILLQNTAGQSRTVSIDYLTGRVRMQ
jgi:prepilin-type N-terminal cleavage/methylation domain-containing protein